MIITTIMFIMLLNIMIVMLIIVLQVTTWIIHLAPVGVCFLIAGQILEMEVLILAPQSCLRTQILEIEVVFIITQILERDKVIIVIVMLILGCCW